MEFTPSAGQHTRILLRNLLHLLANTHLYYGIYSVCWPTRTYIITEFTPSAGQHTRILLRNLLRLLANTHVYYYGIYSACWPTHTYIITEFTPSAGQHTLILLRNLLRLLANTHVIITEFTPSAGQHTRILLRNWLRLLAITHVYYYGIDSACWPTHTYTITEFTPPAGHHTRQPRLFERCANTAVVLNVFRTSFPIFLCAFAKLQKATNSFVMSLRLSARNNLAPTGRIFMKLDIWVFFENLSRKYKFHFSRTRITGTLHDDQYTFSITSR